MIRAPAPPDPPAIQLVPGSPRRPAHTSVWRSLLGLGGVCAVTFLAFPIIGAIAGFMITPLLGLLGVGRSTRSIVAIVFIVAVTLAIPVALSLYDPRWVFGIRDDRDLRRRQARWSRAAPLAAHPPPLVSGRPRRPRVTGIGGVVLGLITLTAAGFVTAPVAYVSVRWLAMPFLAWIGFGGEALALASVWLSIAGAGLLPILLVVNDPYAIFHTRRRGVRSRHNRRDASHAQNAV